MTARRVVQILALIVLASSCAGSDNAETAEKYAAVIVVQHGSTDGAPYNCWIIRNGSSMLTTNGLYWRDSRGHHVRIVGHFIRVQVERDQLTDAAKLAGVDADLCGDGAYPKTGSSRTGESTK